MSQLIIISGPSGVGKTTICKALCLEEGFVESVSTTTRPKRSTEEYGKDYYFISEKSFDGLVNHNAFLEWQQFAGFRYGTTKTELDEKLRKNNFIFVVVEQEGAANIRKTYPNAISIFIAPPNKEELIRRLSGRGDTPDLKERLALVKQTLELAKCHDHIIEAHSVEDCIAEIKNILGLS